ncbi:U4/U6 small nuclear ribonucleoprotein Prp31 [Pogonomyrmex barbatus]|uniref:U4/U6 small nuclear ribonucleoprotein Prp31 n=1 Tax=Pogonomyrmex barbatus TaxID=144034 RepID=A0A6I9W3R5_9HYME|nr:U4/U6 small nuclear ribonucleoprotein Prp31 [Pogonomyrmex barbatus]
MSLADELLADLEENDDAESVIEELEPKFIPTSVSKVIEEEIKVSSVRELAKLRDSEHLQQVVLQIEKYSKVPRKSADIVGPVESDPEYQLIVEANNMAVKIDNEIAIIHRFTRDKYSKRFPELESLVVGPLEYVMTVRELGNDLDRAKNNEILQQFLTQATIMVVSVTASTTQGYKFEFDSSLYKTQVTKCSIADNSLLAIIFLKPILSIYCLLNNSKSKNHSDLQILKSSVVPRRIESDAYQEDLGYSRGTIGKAGTGRIRLPQIDEKTKVRISKTLQKNLQKQQQWGGSTTVKKQVSGTASSVAFTPLQGLEIVNPQAAEKKVNEANAKYFSNTAGFLKVKKS